MSNLNKQFTSWEDAVVWLRAQEDQRTLVFDAYYDDPLTGAADRYLNSAEWDAIRSHLGVKRGAALDVGAGRGIASYALAKEGFSVIALEPDGSSVVGAEAIRNLASESALDIQVVQESSESLPFDDQMFDVIFARAVLHHTSDLQQACHEFYRVLRPGGRFIAIREHVISHESDLHKFLGAHPLHNLYGGEHAFLLTNYTDSLNIAGFEIKALLKPFDSVINFAPHSTISLKDELVTKMKLPTWLAKTQRSLLDFPGVWLFVRKMLAFVDNRPGRLYSFVCERKNI